MDCQIGTVGLIYPKGYRATAFLFLGPSFFDDSGRIINLILLLYMFKPSEIQYKSLPQRQCKKEEAQTNKKT